jgi:small subunit ribosomal protein S21
VIRVEKREDESIEALLKRFRGQVARSRIMSTLKRKRYYVSKSEQRQIVKRRAARKERRRQYKRARAMERVYRMAR